jgi:sulfatase maturation enzyme AslB (radical SAM superfamily)
MKNQINIWNQNTGNEIVTLSQLRTRISQRRMDALNPLSKNSVKKEITVMTTNKELQQVAAHYKSFEIRTFSHAKAIEIYNAGGGQKASLIN